MSIGSTPFARWRVRMGERMGLGRPLMKKDAAEMIGYRNKNSATALDTAEELPLTIALACAALEAGLEPIK